MLNGLMTANHAYPPSGNPKSVYKSSRSLKGGSGLSRFDAGIGATSAEAKPSQAKPRIEHGATAGVTGTSAPADCGAFPNRGDKISGDG